MKRIYITMFIVTLLMFLFATALFAQGVGINTTGAAADESAMLDVTSTTKGMLVPRMLATQRTAIVTPATGLIVYQTDAPSGFYYNAGTPVAPNWVLLIAGSVAGTSNDVPNAIVQRDAAGGFAAGTVTADSNIVLSATTTATRGQIRQGGKTVLHSYGPNNFFAGPNAGNFTLTGWENVGSGYLALAANTSGFQNTATGAYSLQSNTTGNFNTANGQMALRSNTTGSDNVGVGKSALYNNVSGAGNIAVGGYALDHNTAGNQNTALGGLALSQNTTGNYNTAVGKSADVTAADLTNATAIGYNAKVGASNSLVLGGTGADAVKVGIGTTTPTQTLDVVGTAKMTGFNLPTDAAAGRVLISDATGIGTWQTAPTSSQWIANLSDIYYNSGKVSIGTTTPGDAALRVNAAFFE